MLIKFSTIIAKYPDIKGILHVGAHECEELNDYNIGGISNENIIWIEANHDLVASIKKNDKIKVIEACISDTDDQTVKFNVTNNYQSSSILNLKEHLVEHPWVYVNSTISMRTKTIKTLYEENKIKPEFANFINIDIQGAELLCLKGMNDMLHNFDYVYTEVNNKELYENCAIVEQIDEYLKKYNFIREMTVWTQHGWGDALYVKK